MILYSIIILLGWIAVILLNVFLNPQYGDKWWMYIILTIAFSVVAFIIDALVALIIRKLPNKWFMKDKGIFKTSKFEMKFYKFIGVPKWKDYVPELGNFTGFHKNKVVDPFDNEYIGRFILEARYGVAIHLWSVPFSFLVMLCDYNIYLGRMTNIWLTIGLPVAVVNAILIVLPAFILKYNLPKLVHLYERNKRKEATDKFMKERRGE